MAAKALFGLADNRLVERSSKCKMRRNVSSILVRESCFAGAALK
jgi:hypothetical protein